MEDNSKRLSSRIQMLATLVATATYAAGFNPPGGVWQDIHDGAGHHLPGDPIVLSTHHHRYAVFFYCNAIAFTLSLIVVVVTLFITVHPEKEQGRKRKINLYLGIFMVPAMVAFTMAYGAGACRPKFTIVWYSIQVPIPFVIVMHKIFVRQPQKDSSSSSKEEEEKEEAFQDFQSVMVPLSMFALTITYVAGLSTPGGFWDSAEGGHRPGDAILGDRFQGRTLRWFFTLNTTAFLASLYALSLLILKPRFDSNSNDSASIRDELFSKAMWRLLALFYLLLGLLGAYIVGNSRGRVNWQLYGMVLACMVFYVVVHMIFHVFLMETAASMWEWLAETVSGIAKGVWKSLAGLAKGVWKSLADTVSRLAGTVSTRMRQMCGCAAEPQPTTTLTTLPPPTTTPTTLPPPTTTTPPPPAGSSSATMVPMEKQKLARRRRRASIVQLMAGLAVAITYQAGLYPPGGLWPANADGHTAGDPILLATNDRRYKGFHYCNSVSFVASLLAMFLAQRSQTEEFLHDHHALEATMILDMLGLIGAYAIGSCRDQVSTLYVGGLAGVGVVYVFMHVSYFTLSDTDERGAGAAAQTSSTEGEDGEDDVENYGGRFLLFAVLVASMTYQAGLTPPGGFLLTDDAQSGHHAGDPVLLFNYPRRYSAFFYCNSVSFMLSIVIIVLLVNPNEYRPAIRSHALSVCSAASYVCLMGAFAAGSTQHLKGSYAIFVLAGLPSFASLILFVKYWEGLKDEKLPSEPEPPENIERNVYLMTLAILVASATYPAGLEPPGGSWQGSGDGHDAGNPVMRDSRSQRYLAFFVGNTASFLASVVLIFMLLLSAIWRLRQQTPAQDQKEKPDFVTRCKRGLNGGLVILQCLGFLVAYAAGSSRQWKTSAQIGTIVGTVLLFVGIHVSLSFCWKPAKKDKQPGQGQGSDNGGQSTAPTAPVQGPPFGPGSLAPVL